MLAISQFDHFQVTFIYRPNTPISMVFTASDSAFTTRHTHTGSCFRFGSAPQILPELFLCSSPVVYRVPTELGSSSFSVISFGFFMWFMGFSRIPCLGGRQTLY